MLWHGQALGGVQYIFLTHRDDVADHAQWAKEFGAQRVIHASECNSQQGTECVHLAYLPCKVSHC